MQIVPFSDYLDTKPSWSAFIKRETCNDWKILASAYDTHAVSLEKRMGMGYIILLPGYYDHHNGEILEKCIKKLGKNTALKEEFTIMEIEAYAARSLLALIAAGITSSILRL